MNASPEQFAGVQVDIRSVKCPECRFQRFDNVAAAFDFRRVFRLELNGLPQLLRSSGLAGSFANIRFVTRKKERAEQL
jgi:hypothetical protein